MYSLKELIQDGKHELAAHRIVLGVVHAYVRQRQAEVPLRWPVATATSAGMPRERSSDMESYG